MSTGRVCMDTVSFNADGAVINMPKREPFQHEIADHICLESFHCGTHPTQIPQAFLTDIGKQPDIMVQLDLLVAQSPQDPKQCGHAKRVISNTRCDDLSRLFLNL